MAVLSSSLPWVKRWMRLRNEQDCCFANSLWTNLTLSENPSHAPLNEKYFVPFLASSNSTRSDGLSCLSKSHAVKETSCFATALKKYLRCPSVVPWKWTNFFAQSEKVFHLPGFSLLIPVYRGRSLQHQVHLKMKQTFGVFEIISASLFDCIQYWTYHNKKNRCSQQGNK